MYNPGKHGYDALLLKASTEYWKLQEMLLTQSSQSRELLENDIQEFIEEEAATSQIEVPVEPQNPKDTPALIDIACL